MAKRKREEESNADGAVVRLSAKARRVQHKLEQSTTKLGHAFKIAKVFEVQKLARRRRKAAAQEGSRSVQRIDAEAAAVKTFNTTTCARSHLFKSLLKIKAVADSDNLPAEVKQPVELPSNAAALNVHGRLCNANTVKEALALAVTEIEQALGLPASGELGSKRKRHREKDKGSDTLKDRDIAINGPGYEMSTHAVDSPHRNGVDGEDKVDARPVEESDDNLVDFRDRIASSEDEEDQDMSDVDDLEKQLMAGGVVRKRGEVQSAKYDPAVDLSLSEDEQDSQGASPEPQKAPATKKSAFLPSLTLGGYISGSGSDVDDDFDGPPKKNRRGQRARQQLWEKKYGLKAKHLQKQTRDQGWDPRRGAVTGDADGFGRRKQRDHAGHDPGPPTNARFSSKSASHQRQSTKDDDGPLHPSWQAAKKAKEQRSGPVAFQGKKVTFD